MEISALGIEWKIVNIGGTDGNPAAPHCHLCQLIYKAVFVHGKC